MTTVSEVCDALERALRGRTMTLEEARELVRRFYALLEPRIIRSTNGGAERGISDRADEERQP